MAIEAARLMVEIVADISKLTKGAADANGVLGKVGKTLAITGAGMTAAVTLPAIAAAKGMLDVAMSMEQSQIAFTTMLGSAEKAGAFLQELRDFAKSTPFEFTELQDAARRMLAFGFSAEKVLPMMTDIGDAVSGLGLGADGVNRVTLALGQMQAKSKVSGQEMMQLTEAGIPAWKYLAEAMGKSTAEVMKMSEQGLIPAGQAIDYILGGMRQDFGGMMAAQSQTAAGQLSNLKDSIVELAASLGESLLPIAKDLIAKAQEAVQQFNELDDAGKKNALRWLAIAAAAGPAMTAIGGATGALGAASKAMVALGVSTAAALPILLGVGAAVAAITAGVLAWEKKQDELTAQRQEIFTTAKSYDEYKKSIDALAVSQGYQINQSGDLVQVITMYGQTQERVIQENYAYTESSWGAMQAQQGMNEMVAQGIPYFGYLGQTIQETASGLVALGNGAIVSQSSFDAMVAGASNSKDSLQGLLGEVKNIQTEMNNWVTNTADSVQSMLGQKLPESSKLYSDSLAVVDEVMGTQYLQAYNLEKSTKALVDQYVRTGDVNAFREGLKKIKEEGLAGMQSQLETATEKAQLLYDKLMNLPANVRIKIELDDSQLPAWLKTESLGTGMMGLAGASAIPEALGGPVYPGLSYLVGEHGPELFNPSTPGTILPNQQSSSRTLQVTVYNSGAEAMDEDRLAQAISQWEWAYGI